MISQARHAPKPLKQGFPPVLLAPVLLACPLAPVRQAAIGARPCPPGCDLHLLHPPPQCQHQCYALDVHLVNTTDSIQYQGKLLTKDVHPLKPWPRTESTLSCKATPPHFHVTHNHIWQKILQELTNFKTLAGYTSS